MPLRPCLDCGTLTQRHPRCQPCEGRKQQARNRSRDHYSGAWDATSRKLRAEHVERHGPVCPGWDRDAHPVDPATLCLDHVNDRDATVVQVLCRSCNSRKAATKRTV